MIATVNVRLYYQPHCPECMRQVEETIASTIRDSSVAGVSLVASKKCEHDALSAPRLHGNPSTSAPRPSSEPKGTPPPPGSMALLPNLTDPTNGFD